MRSPPGHDVIQCAPLRSSSVRESGWPLTTVVGGSRPSSAALAPWPRIQVPDCNPGHAGETPAGASSSSSSVAERLVANEKVAGSGPAYCSSGSRC